MRNKKCKKKADESWEFCLVNSVIQKICKNRTKFVSEFEQNWLRIKCFQKPELSGIDEALLK